MEKTKKILLISMAIALAFMLAGCGACKNSGEKKQAAGLRGDLSEEYYLVNFDSDTEYWFPVFEGFKQAGNLLGVKTFYSGCDEDSTETELFNQILAKNPKGIFISPSDAEALKEQISRAAAMGIAVVTVVSGSPESGRNSCIASDSSSEGQHAARIIGNALGGEGKVMTLRNPGRTGHDIRVDAFIAAIRNEFPGIMVVADSISGQDPDKAYSVVMAVAKMYPDLGAVWTPETCSAIGASRASVELGGGKAGILVMCAGINGKILDMIQTGEIFGAINPDQGMQGFFGMITLFMTAHPELAVPMNGKEQTGQNPVFIPNIDSGHNLVTKENAQYFYAEKYALSLGYSGMPDMLSPGTGGN